MIKPPKPTDPARAIAVSVVLERLRIQAPVAAVALVVMALTPGLALLLTTPATLRDFPEQQWTTAPSGIVSLASSAVRTALPPPDPRQKPPPCDPELAEEEFLGVCWQRLPVLKCNEQKAYPHNGRCYLRVMKVAPLEREPTSGDHLAPTGVADPE